MATSRKKKAPKASPTEMDFFNPKSAGSKASSKKEKPAMSFPTEPEEGSDKSLSVMMDELAAANAVIEAAQRKVAEAESSIRKFLLEEFITTWAEEGSRPESSSWKGERSKLDYVMTSRITFSAAKQEMIQEELDIPMKDHFKLSGFKIDFNKLKNNPEYFKAFADFISKIDKEELDNYVVREVKLEKNFFDNLLTLCGDRERLSKMMNILKPPANLKGIKSSNKEEDSFMLIKEMEG